MYIPKALLILFSIPTMHQAKSRERYNPKSDEDTVGYTPYSYGIDPGGFFARNTAIGGHINLNARRRVLGPETIPGANI